MADADKKVGLTADQEAQRLKSMNNEQVLKEIDAHFKSVEAYMDPKALEDSKIKMAEAVDQARQNDKKNAAFANPFAKVLVYPEAGVSVAADKSGLTSTTFSGQAPVGKVGGVSGFAGASAALDKNNALDSVSTWGNGVLDPFKFAGSNIFIVGQGRGDFPSGGKFGLGSFTGTLGGIVNPEGTKVNLVGLGSAALDGSQASATFNASLGFNGQGITGKGEGSVDAGLTQNILGPGTNVTVGAIWIEPDAFANNVGSKTELRVTAGNVQSGNPDLGFMLSEKVVWGQGAQTEKASDLATEVLKRMGRDKPAQTPDYLSSAANAPVADAGKTSTPPKEEPVLTAEYKRHDETTSAAGSNAQAAAEKPINLAQNEKQIFKLTEESFTKGLEAAASLYNSLPGEEQKKQFKHDFDANLAKSPMFGSMKAASAFTSEEFAAYRDKQEHRDTQLAMTM